MVMHLTAAIMAPVIAGTLNAALKKVLEEHPGCLAAGEASITEVSVITGPEERELDHPSGLPTTLSGQTFDQFFLTHYEAIRQRAYAAGLDLHLADDVTQEAMIIAAQFWERISVMEYPVAYVATIAINLLRRVRRKEAKLRTTLGQARPDQQQQMATTPGPENAVIARLDLEQALRFIPAEQAECFVLRHMFGYLNREIAQTQGIPEGTVKSRVHAARESLREILGDDTMGGLR